MYVNWSVIAGETPTATKWNILGENDDYFNNTLNSMKQYARYTWLKDYSIFIENAIGIIYPISRAQTVKKIMCFTQSGTATIRIKKYGGADIKTTINVTSSMQTITTFDSSSLSIADAIQCDITAANGVKLNVLLEAEELTHT